MRVNKVTEPDRTLNIVLNKEDVVWLIANGGITTSRNIPREEGFDVQFISIRLEDFKK